MSDIIASDFDGARCFERLGSNDPNISVKHWPGVSGGRVHGDKVVGCLSWTRYRINRREGRSLKFGSGTSWIAETSDIQGFKGILRSQRCLFTKLFAALWRSDLRNATTYCVGQGKVPIFNPCQSSIVESWNDCHQWFKSDPSSLSCRWRPALPNS